MSPWVVEVKLCCNNGLDGMQRIELVGVKDSNSVKVRFSDDVHQGTLRDVQDRRDRCGGLCAVGEIKFRDGVSTVSRLRCRVRFDDFRELVVGVETGASVYQPLHHLLHEGGKSCLVALVVDDIETLTRNCVIVTFHWDVEIFGDKSMDCWRVERPLV